MYQLLPELAGKRVLSLGCGSGEDSHYLKTQGASESIGIDLSSELIKIAQDSHTDCTFSVMDMEQLGFPDSSFDFAYSSLAIHYLEQWEKTFQEVYRVLKPNSYFLFSCAHPQRTAMVITENNEAKKVTQLSVTKDRQQNTEEVIGDYLHRHPIDTGLGEVGSVTTWHKPISEIVAEARQAGFFIDAIVEPQPLLKMGEIAPNNYKRLQLLPEFIIFKLWKP